MTGAPHWLRRPGVAFGMGWLALVVVHAALHVDTLAVLPGDEGIYLYGGKLVADGHWPWSDFFLAHPPLRVFIAGLLHGMGAPLWVPKALELLAVSVAGGLAGLAVLPATRPAFALLSAGLFVFSALSLETGGFFVGSNIAAALVAGTYLAASRGSWLTAGLLLSVGGLQALYALVPMPVLALWAWREGKLRRFGLGLLALVLALLVLWAVTGPPFIEQVVLYHFRKVARNPDAPMFSKLFGVVVADVALVFLALTGCFCRVRTHRLAATAGFFCLAVVGAYRQPFGHYFMMAFPFLAAAAGLGLHAATAALQARAGSIRLVAGLGLGVAVLATYGPHILRAIDLGARREASGRDLRALARAVEQDRPASGLLWGDSSVVPALALETGMEIAARMVDANEQRFAAGMPPAGEALYAVFTGPMPGVILLARHGVAGVPELRTYVEAHLKPAFSFVAPGMGHHVTYYLGPEDFARFLARRSPPRQDRQSK